LEGVPTGTRIGHVNTILSNAGKLDDLTILIAVTLLMSEGGVVVQTGAEQPVGFTAGEKSE
jgi:hypothetical protein